MTVNIPGALVMADWNWLHETGELSEADSLNQRINAAAPRIGMTAAALEQALRRAGVRNPVTPLLLGGRQLGNRCLTCRKSRADLVRAEAGLARAARRLSDWPTSPRLRRLFDQAQAEMADRQAFHDWHLDADHAEVETVAA